MSSKSLPIEQQFDGPTVPLQANFIRTACFGDSVNYVLRCRFDRLSPRDSEKNLQRLVYGFSRSAYERRLLPCSLTPINTLLVFCGKLKEKRAAPKKWMTRHPACDVSSWQTQRKTLPRHQRLSWYLGKQCKLRNVKSNGQSLSEKIRCILYRSVIAS